jgi:hypothetical protein
MKISLIGWLAAVALLSGPLASSEPVQKNDGAAAFARLQSLIGEWEAPLPKNEVMKNVFRPIAFGTALAHEEWKNGEQLTATVFYVVGSQLHADHYCDMGNQLRYVAAPVRGQRYLPLHSAQCDQSGHAPAAFPIDHVAPGKYGSTGPALGSCHPRQGPQGRAHGLQTQINS